MEQSLASHNSHYTEMHAKGIGLVLSMLHVQKLHLRYTTTSINNCEKNMGFKLKQVDLVLT